MLEVLSVTEVMRCLLGVVDVVDVPEVMPMAAIRYTANTSRTPTKLTFSGTPH